MNGRESTMKKMNNPKLTYHGIMPVIGAEIWRSSPSNIDVAAIVAAETICMICTVFALGDSCSEDASFFDSNLQAL